MSAGLLAILLPLASAQAVVYGTVATTGFHTCATTTTGVKCWGSNGNGQLGDGTTTDSTGPIPVKGFANGVAALAAGGHHTCVVTNAGGAKCWGSNGNGQLGDGTTSQRLTPAGVSGLGSGVAAIALGWDHTCALTTSGAVECWGYNGFGELGDGTLVDRDLPVSVSGLGSGVLAISAGEFHTCALTTGGGVQCWGRNNHGELGDGTYMNSSIPVPVSGLGAGVAAVSAGGLHTCALTTGGGVECWGDGGWGELGDGTFTTSNLPVGVSGLGTGVGAVSTGGAHTCALTLGGAAECWGYNGDGEVGDGTTVNRGAPVGVTGLGGGVAGLASGGAHTCALTTSGGIKCWGNDGFGQLGDGTQTNSPTPVDLGIQTTTRLSLQMNTVAQGGMLQLKATVKPKSGSNAAGSVTFRIDGVAVGSKSLNSHGKASLTITVTQAVGTHQVQAIYAGGPPDGGSHSRLKTLTVT